MNLNLTYKRLWIGVGDGLLISMRLASFDCHLTGAVDVKMNGSELDKRSSFTMLGLFFSSILD